MSIDRLHASEWRGVFYVTGGGSLVTSNLLTVPGASATVLEARIPYSEAALCDLLGSKPVQACSSTVARMLAMQAYLKACELDHGDALFGFGLTASLATNRSKRGRLRAYVALQTMSRTQVSEIEFSKRESRELQEQQLWNMAFQKLCIGLGLSIEGLNQDLDLVFVAPDELQPLIHVEPTYLGEPGKLFFPGAFNPLHEGHRRMKELAESICKAPCKYELCVRNFDKPVLDFLEIRERCNQFSENEFVLTNVPRFTDKAHLLAPGGGATFVVGVDTLVRIADRDYYANNEGVDEAIQFFTSRGDRFLVFGRVGPDNSFVSLNDVTVPHSLLRLCRGLAEEEFRMDISSTKIRRHNSCRLDAS